MVVQGSLKGEGQPNLPKGIDQQQVCGVVRWHYLYAEQVTWKKLVQTSNNMTPTHRHVYRIHFVPSQPGL